MTAHRLTPHQIGALFADHLWPNLASVDPRIVYLPSMRTWVSQLVHWQHRPHVRTVLDKADPPGWNRTVPGISGANTQTTRAAREALIEALRGSGFAVEVDEATAKGNPRSIAITRAPEPVSDDDAAGTLEDIADRVGTEGSTYLYADDVEALRATAHRLRALTTT